MLSKLKHSIAAKGLTWFVMILLLDMAGLAVFFDLLNRAEKQAETLERSRQISLLTNGLTDALMDVDSSFGKFVKTGNAKLGFKIANKIEQFDTTLEELKNYYKDKPEELALLDELSKLKRQAVKLMSSLKIGEVAADDQERKKFGHDVDGLFRPIALKLESTVLKLVHRQYEDQRQQVKNENKTRSDFKYVILICCVGNMIFSVILSILFTRSVSTRLANIVENMNSFENDLPLSAPLKGNDEIVFLDNKFHEMSETITQARRREQMTTEYVSDLILSFDSTGKFITVSQSTLQFWGFEVDELIGTEVLEKIVQKDKTNFAECVRLAKYRSSRKNFEGQVFTADGEPIDTLWTFNWVEEEESMFCVAHDITQRKQNENLLAENERRIRAVLEAIPVGLAVLDHKGRVLFLNEKLLLMLGTTLDELSMRPFVDYFDKNIVLIDFSSAEQPKSPIESFVTRPLLADLPVEISFGAISMTNQTAVLCTILDISERRKIEEARTQFLHMITHDMRTPLTSARGYFQLLEADAYESRPDALRIATERASRNISEVISLISELLDISKLKSGNFELARSVTDIAEVINGAVSSINELAASKNIKIVVHDCHETMEIDTSLISRVLINLLSNACKYAPTFSSVEVRAERLPTCLKIYVSDQGRGIPAAETARIFESFRQASADDFRQGLGTGLGLAICKRIIEVHGGLIGVESIQGQGSTFWFTLPV